MVVEAGAVQTHRAPFAVNVVLATAHTADRAALITMEDVLIRVVGPELAERAVVACKDRVAVRASAPNGLQGLAHHAPDLCDLETIDRVVALLVVAESARIQEPAARSALLAFALIVLASHDLLCFVVPRDLELVLRRGHLGRGSIGEHRLGHHELLYTARLFAWRQRAVGVNGPHLGAELGLFALLGGTFHGSHLET
eukprot:Amastigsp_a175225_370.p2 type:complete len:198 gc:universal Amastigsp_a175225_370:522-1115(+)